jgi:hypothetical protein
MRQRVINLCGCVVAVAVWLLMLYYAAWAASLAP